MQKKGKKIATEKANIKRERKAKWKKRRTQGEKEVGLKDMIKMMTNKRKKQQKQIKKKEMG